MGTAPGRRRDPMTARLTLSPQQPKSGGGQEQTSQTASRCGPAQIPCGTVAKRRSGFFIEDESADCAKQSATFFFLIFTPAGRGPESRDGGSGRQCGESMARCGRARRYVPLIGFCAGTAWKVLGTECACPLFCHPVPRLVLGNSEPCHQGGTLCREFCDS